jgi:DNA-binding TFAR19-related protein (PDSD5 family)
MRSQTIVRDALNDPRDINARLACQIVAQYRDTEAISSLQQLAMSRPELAAAANETLRQLQG